MWNPDTDTTTYPGWFAARPLRPLTAAEVAAAGRVYDQAAADRVLTAAAVADFKAVAGTATRLPMPRNMGGKAKDPALAAYHDALRAILTPGTAQAKAQAAAAVARSEKITAAADAVAKYTGAAWVDAQMTKYGARVAAAEAEARESLRAVLRDAARVDAGQVQDPAEVERIRAQVAALKRAPNAQVVRHLLGAEAAGLGAIAPIVLMAAIGGAVVYLAILSTVKAICAARQVRDVTKAQAEMAGRALAIQEAALKDLPRDASGKLTPEGAAAAAAIAKTAGDIQAAGAAATASSVNAIAAASGSSAVPVLLVVGVGVAAAVVWWFTSRRRVLSHAAA